MRFHFGGSQICVAEYCIFWNGMGGLPLEGGHRRLEGFQQQCVPSHKTESLIVVVTQVILTVPL